MTRNFTPELKEFKRHRELVCVRRAGVDAHYIQGFILNFSHDLVLLHYVFDFHLDGFLLLRRSDLTSVEVRKTDRFKRSLLDEEGVLSRVDYGYHAPIESYGAFLTWLPPNEIVILEDELLQEKDFLIGTVSSVTDSTVSVRYFSGAANWLDEPWEMDLSRISSCQVRTNYTQFYTRHFERSGYFHVENQSL